MKINIIKAIFIIIATAYSICILNLNAQNVKECKTMTLKECMKFAVENSAKIRIQQTENADARVNRKDAVLQAFTPNINANTQVYSNFGRTIDPETNTYVSTTSFNNSYAVSAGITLFNGFAAINNMKISKTAKAMGLSKEQQIKDEICLETIQAYYNAVYYSALTKILEEQAETIRKSLMLVEEQEKLGQKGYADVVQAKAELADKEFEVTSAQNSLKNAYITLKEVMFWPVSEELSIDTSAAEDDINILYEETDTRNIVQTALLTNPGIFLAKSAMENARLSLMTAKWKLAPSLDLYGGWSTSYYTYPGQTGYTPTPFGRQFKDNGGEFIQLTLSIPIFDRLSRQSEISRKKNAYARSTAQYEQKIHEVESEVLRAIQDRDGAEAAFYSAERRSEVQEEAYRLNIRKFELGLISTIEYQTASDNYLKAKAERLNALLQYHLKNKVVTYYNGVSYLEQE